MTETAAPAQLALNFGVNLHKDSPVQLAAQALVASRNGKGYIRFAGKVSLRPFASAVVPPLGWF